MKQIYVNGSLEGGNCPTWVVCAGSTRGELSCVAGVLVVEMCRIRRENAKGQRSQWVNKQPRFSFCKHERK